MVEAPEMTVIVSNCSDLMPDLFSGEGFSYDCKHFFIRFRSVQDARLPTEDAKVEAYNQFYDKILKMTHLHKMPVD